MRNRKILSLYVLFSAFTPFINAQQNILNYIKIYFNTPVDTSFAKGVNATYVRNAIMDTIANYINRAKYTVDIAQFSYYAYSGDTLSHIATAVNNAYSRGVKVRWIYDGSVSGGNGLALLNSNIPTEASPVGNNYGIMHNKIVVIDEYAPDSTQSFVLTGSEDWDDWMNDFIYNNLVCIQSEVLAKAYTHEFNIMWGDTNHGNPANSGKALFGMFKPNSGRHIFEIGGSEVELYFSPSDTTNTHILRTIATANFDLYCGMYTFTEDNDAYALVNQQKAGAFAAAILDNYSNGYNAYNILQLGISNFRTYVGYSIYHNKYLIVNPSDPCSDPKVLTGSQNWTGGANQYNDENYVIIHNDTIANLYLQAFAHDYLTSGGDSLHKVKSHCTLGINPTGKTESDISILPNPYRGKVSIDYDLVNDARVTLCVYNIMGEKVATIVKNKILEAGDYIFHFEGALPGVYILQIQEGDAVYTKKLVQVE